MSYASEVLADSPLSYWDFQETAGTNANDQGSLNHDGTITGGVLLNQTGPIVGGTGKAFKFDGVDDECIATGGSADYRLNGNFTIEFWAKNVAFPGAGSFDGLIYKYHGFNTTGWEIFYDSTGRLSLKRNNVDVSVANVAGDKLSQSAFKHFVFTYNGTVAKWYVNGVLSSTTTITYPATTDTTHDLSVGVGDGSGFGNNIIAHVAIYGTALSPARILRHYNRGSGTLDVRGVDDGMGTLVGRIQQISTYLGILYARGVDDGMTAATLVGRWNTAKLAFLFARAIPCDVSEAVGRADFYALVRNVKSRLTVRLSRR